MPFRILMIRFSAMGDVAMTVPVIRCALRQYPDLEFVVLSRPAFRDLFAGLERVHFIGADLKGKHKGIPGLFRLSREVCRAYKINAVADMHQVLRSKILRAFFRLKGIRTASLDKGRNEKKALTRKENKVLEQLPTSFERYAAVLNNLGYPVQLDVVPIGLPDLNRTTPERRIGIAPFAQHAGKMYPAERMEHVIELLLQYPDYTLYLFGGGAGELAKINAWKEKFPAIVVAAGKYSLAEELELMKKLDLMISMDSANMHLASLVGIPVVSIWGATHPYAGFYGWQQDPANIVQVNLFCRPCSVFGNKSCYRGDLACMNMLEPERIVKQVLEVVNKEKRTS